MYIYLIQFTLAFAVSYIFLKMYIRKAINKGIVGKDIHKVDKREVAEMGGFGLIFGFLFGLGIAYPLIELSSAYYILAVGFSIVIAALIGAFDDLVTLTPLQKIILLLIASIPLVITRSGDSSITIPYLISINLGIFYYILFIPIYFTVLSNASNMLAGYNGLEVGIGIITISFYSVFLTLTGKYLGLFILLPMLAALIALYLYNKYPAKVFPGDVGTLPIGAAIAGVSIITHSEMAAILISSLYILNFSIYFIYKFFYSWKYKESHISNVDKRGILERQYFDKKKKKIQWHKIYFLFEHIFYPLNERRLVLYFFMLSIATSFSGLLISILLY